MKIFFLLIINFALVIVIYGKIKNVSFQYINTFGCEKNSRLLSYGNNWVVDAFSNTSAQYSRLYVNSTLIKTTKLNYKPKIQYAAFNNNPNFSIYSIIDNNSLIHSYEKNQFIEIYQSNFTADKINYLSQNVLTAYNNLERKVYLYNFSNLLTIYKGYPDEKFIDIHSQGGKICLYTNNNITNDYNIFILNQNLSQIAKIICSSPDLNTNQLNHKIKKSNSSQLLMRIQFSKVQFYNTSNTNNPLVYTFAPTFSIIDAEICNQFVIYASGTSIYVYLLDGWKQMNILKYNVLQSITQLKCFESQYLIGVYFDVSDVVVQFLGQTDFIFYHKLIVEHSNLYNTNVNFTNINNQTINQTANQTINLTQYLQLNSTLNISNINFSIIQNNIPSFQMTQYIQIYNNYCYKQQYKGLCQVYCDYKCKSCSPSQPYGNCITCEQNYVQDTYGTCKLSNNAMIGIMIGATVSIFKINSLQSFLFIIDKLQLYNYQQINHTGIVVKIFNQIIYFQNNLWSFLPFKINDYVQAPYDNYPYIYFTNKQYINIQKADSLLFQSLKPFYLIYIPITFLIFVIMNRIFIWISKYKISVFLCLFYFWSYFTVITLLSNSTHLSFYSLKHFDLLFSINYKYKFLNCISIFFIGNFFIYLISFYYMNYYFNQNLSKYFLSNMYRCKISIIYSFIRYSIIPLSYASIHALLFSYNKFKYLFLFSLQLIIFLLSIVFQIKYSIFKIKSLLLAQTISNFCMILFNLLSYFKYFKYQQISQIVNILEECIKTLCFIMGGMIFLVYLFVMLQLIYKVLKNKYSKIPKEIIIIPKLYEFKKQQYITNEQRKKARVTKISISQIILQQQNQKNISCQFQFESSRFKDKKNMKRRRKNCKIFYNQRNRLKQQTQKSLMNKNQNEQIIIWSQLRQNNKINRIELINYKSEKKMRKQQSNFKKSRFKNQQ